MLRDIPPAVAARMRLLEEMDAADRVDGTPFQRRLRQIPPDTGRLLALLAAGAPPGEWVEIGASAGYSALWLSLAGRATGSHLTTYEPDAVKIELARETFRAALLGDVVTLVEGDARDLLPARDGIGFCFLDALKEVYLDCFELVVPRLVSGGLLVADNVSSHAEELAPFVRRALEDERVDALVLTQDRGLLLCRRTGRGSGGAGKGDHGCEHA